MKVDEAFEEVERSLFVSVDMRDLVGFDMPLSIGFGQTISQPSTVRSMLTWLEVKPGMKVLDVGSGSGWTTALLSYLAGPQGSVYAVERISELLVFGEHNCQKLGIPNVHFYLAEKSVGLEQFAPYDRILVSASAKEVPDELTKQLKVGGKMVIPVGNDILEITKSANNSIEKVVHPGYVFVPLV